MTCWTVPEDVDGTGLSRSKLDKMYEMVQSYEEEFLNNSSIAGELTSSIDEGFIAPIGLGQGESRVTLIDHRENNIIKIAYSEGDVPGRVQNRTESVIWNAVQAGSGRSQPGGRGDIRYFSPVVEQSRDYRWIIQQRCLTTGEVASGPEERDEIYEDAVSTLTEAYSSLSEEDSLLDNSNIGIWGGYRFIDYGSELSEEFIEEVLSEGYVGWINDVECESKPVVSSV